MFEHRGVCLAIYDEDFGPTSLHFKGIDKEAADKIALKTMVGAVALSHHVEEGESIIPIQEQRRTAFVYYFSIPDEKARGGERVGTLSFVVDQEENESLYRFASVLSEHSKKIVQEVKKHYIYRQPLPQALKDSMDSLLSIQDFEKELAKKQKKNLIKRTLKQEKKIW
ncbi:MAG: hypothetical protein KIH08_03160 [Candidatus Freyarchaeota archaeon]|nr:hypothetical protein [Candidatus Jordarchaeia archaeon]MBS7268429.1 hypothetical protein [Candidatus Jordarchaeia archaeon]MBS7279357.1 hypothetical protein [Candidatus Jordarchaeia archaeon]